MQLLHACMHTTVHNKMSRDLKNKIVAITGAAQGIGFEIANVFLKKGAKTVIILDINEELGVAAALKLNSNHGSKAVFYKCDVTTDLDDVSKKILDEYTTIDVLVNNAGIADELNIRKIININVTAVIEWSIKFYEHMRKDKGGNGGTIINLGSVYSFRIDPIAPTYKASKFAVLGLTKTLGHIHNYKKSAVRVVALCPGITETNIFEGDSNNIELQEELKVVLKYFIWQKPDVVGIAAGEVFECADSGTAWKIEGGKPIEEIHNIEIVEV